MTSESHQDTRTRAFEAALDLLRQGQRPSVAAIRERLGGQGGQDAIRKGLADCWQAVGEQVAAGRELPDLPETVAEALTTAWRQLVTAAQDSVEQLRKEREAERANWAQVEQHLQAHVEQLEAENARLIASLKDCEATIEAERDAREAAEKKAREANEVLEAQRQACAEQIETLEVRLRGLTATLEAAQESLRVQQTEREALASRLEATEQASLAAAQEATQQIARLESQKQRWRRVAARYQQDRESLTARIDTLNARLAESVERQNALRETLAQAKAVRTEVEAERNAMAARLETCKGQYRGLEAQLAAQQQISEALRAEVAQLNAHAQRLAAAIDNRNPPKTS